MDTRLKSLLTLGGLGVLLLVAATWGWSALTEPFPERSDPPVCVDHTFSEGQRVATRDVTVSVWNAGTRNGLAGLTMELLEEAGFARGQEGNAPRQTKVAHAQVWSSHPADHPAVRLVASHLGDVEVKQREAPAAGVLVVVGNDFKELAKGRRRVAARSDVEVCGPPNVG